MTLPKWARMHLALNRLKNRYWGLWTDKALTRERQDDLHRALSDAWRMGFRAGKRKGTR